MGASYIYIYIYIIPKSKASQVFYDILPIPFIFPQGRNRRNCRSKKVYILLKIFLPEIWRRARVRPNTKKIHVHKNIFVVFCRCNKFNLQKLTSWYSYNTSKILGARARANPPNFGVGNHKKHQKCPKICFFSIAHPQIWSVGARVRPIF